MPTLKQLKKSTTNYLSAYNGTTEFDQSINCISRYKIDAMKKEYGKCFLGKINLYGEERKKDYKLVEYTYQRVYNFDYSFIIPVHDTKIEQMITDRDRAEYTGTKDDLERINEIMERIEELNGVNLFWS